jgi:hypothetical protein
MGDARDNELDMLIEDDDVEGDEQEHERKHDHEHGMGGMGERMDDGMDGDEAKGGAQAQMAARAAEAAMMRDEIEDGKRERERQSDGNGVMYSELSRFRSR